MPASFCWKKKFMPAACLGTRKFLPKNCAAGILSTCFCLREIFWLEPSAAASVSLRPTSPFWQWYLKSRGRGIGSYLVQTVLDLAKSADLKAVTLEVRVENRKAQELYRRLGFEDNFVRKNYYNNDDRPDSDGLNMICHLRKKN